MLTAPLTSQKSFNTILEGKSEFSPAMLNIDLFLRATGVIFDVRAPKEYSQGRIPGAINIPLFDDQEREKIGIYYKHQGKDAAIKLGLEKVEPKLTSMTEAFKEALGSEEQALVYCARGGMRSSSIHWLLNFCGIKTSQLIGGYRSFRRDALRKLEEMPSSPFIVLGGLTGSGKTSILEEMEKSGEQVLQLERLACHRGSAFGSFGLPPQPTSEQFENEIAFKISSFDFTRPIWVEDESRQMGKCTLPKKLFEAITKAPLIWVDSPLEERIFRLEEMYGNISRLELISSVKKIQKRLGPEKCQKIVDLLQKNECPEAIFELLSYYDKSYEHSQKLRKGTCLKIHLKNKSPGEWAQHVLSSEKGAKK